MVQTTVFLADFARVEHGKLYVLGGLIDRIMPSRLPFQETPHLVFSRPFTAGQRVEFVVQMLSPGGVPIAEVSLSIDVNAAPDHSGDSSTVTLAMPLPCLFTEAGRYLLLVSVDGADAARLPLDVISPLDLAPL